MTSILDAVMGCKKCAWIGILKHTELEADPDGKPLCPRCGGELRIVEEYREEKADQLLGLRIQRGR